MADVSGKFYSATKVRTGVSPSSPGVEVGETLPPVNPPGSDLNSVGLTMPTAFAVANSPLTSNGTLEVTGAGTTAQYIRGDGSLASFPSLTGYVPYTGATADVDLGTHDLTAERGIFTNNGSSDTLTVNHTSGSGYGIKVTKGGNNEALLVTKTSGSGNAMAVVGGRTALVDLSLSSVSNATGNFLTISGGVVHQRTASETRSDVGAQAQLNGTGFVKASGTTITYDNSTYQVTSDKAQPNGYASLDSNGKVPLTQINDALIGNVNYQGLWNASTNTPTLANPPSSGTKGYYYIVSTAGTFAGISFEVGDWIISSGSAWQKIDNTDAVSSVFGRTGNVVAANGDYTTAQVTESGNLYYTDGRARAALSFAAGSGAYNTSTGVITIPTNNNQITNGAGYITSAGTITGASGALTSRDNRTISPSEDNAGQLKFGFTSWANNDGAPYADYLHLRSYTDSSGGNDNLVMFLKSGIGMRIYQQSFGSSTAYSSFKDIAFTDGTNASGTWGINITGNSTSVINTVTGTNTAELVRGNMADNDHFRILVGGTGNNAGYAEIATADDGTEPIYVRQYTGVFSTLIRTATLLDGSGNTSFPGTITGSSIIKNGGTSSQFLKADGSVDSNTYVTGGPFLPLTGGTLTGPLGGTTAQFSGKISVANATGVLFNGPSDENWKIYRTDTPNFTRSLITLFSLNINAHYGGEGFAIGANGGSSYYEILGSAGTTPQHFMRGSVGIDTASNAGFKLDVNGTGRFSDGLTATSNSSLFKEGFRINATTTGGPGSQPAYTYYTAAGSKRWSHFLNVGDDKFHIANASNSELFTIQQNGNVGVGTNSPGRLLSLYKSSTPILQFVDDASGTGSSNGFLVYIGGLDAYLENTSNGFMSFQTNGGERMRIFSDGNLSISNSPSNAGFKLDVNGTGRFTPTSSASVPTLMLNQGAAYGNIAGLDMYHGFILRGIPAAAGDYSVTATDQISFYEYGGIFNFYKKQPGVLLRQAYIDNGSFYGASFFETSDATIKTLVEDDYQAKGIDSVVAKLYIKNGKQELGYFAQDLQGVLPSAVSKGSDGLLNLSYREVHTAKIAYLEEEIRQIKKRYEIN
jgi:hypothetical protein